jgi:hypothetical protein
MSDRWDSEFFQDNIQYNHRCRFLFVDKEQDLLDFAVIVEQDFVQVLT